MAVVNSDLTPFARKLLIHHGQWPDRAFYAEQLPGGVQDYHLARLDSAYQELVDAGLMEWVDEAPVFGKWRYICRPTQTGLQAIKELAA